MKKYVYYMLLLIVLGNSVSCSSGYDDSFWEEIMDIPGGNGMGNGNGSVSDDGDIPTFDLQSRNGMVRWQKTLI